MKKILLLLCCVFSVLIYSCHKDSKVIPADYYFEASKNAADWAAQGNTYTIPGDSIKLTGLMAAGEEQIYMNIKFNGNGTYPLTGKQAAFFTTTGGDVLTSNYRLDTTRKSLITVLSYSAKTRIISGTFELHVLKDSNDPTVYVPVDFNNGIFRLKLPD